MKLSRKSDVVYRAKSSYLEGLPRYFGCYSVIALTSATILAGVILSSPISSAIMTTSRVSVMVSTMCTLSGNVTEDHSVTVSGGTYADNIGSTTLKTLCNDGTGYSIYAVGYTDNTYGDNTMLGTYNGGRIITGTATSGDVSNWAMRLTAVSGEYMPTIENGFSSYSEVPNTITKVASYPAATDSGENAIGSNITATYATYISGGQRNDTYVGQVAYILVHPSGGVASILEAFGFEGVFGYYGKERYKGFFRMQDMTSEICNAVTTPASSSSTHYSIQLIDSRDDKLYWVAKMADGKCWMTQNLDLNLSNGTVLTYYDTDLGHTTNDTTARWVPSDSTVTSVGGFSSSRTDPRSYDPGDLYYYTSGTTANDTVYSSLAECQNAGHSDCEHYHVGNYYNGPAAWAENSATYTNAGAVKANSICPAGWRLSYWAMNSDYSSVSSSEFNTLLYAEGVVNNDLGGTSDIGYTRDGFNLARSEPLYLTRTGLVISSNLNFAGEAGFSYTNYVASSGYNASNDGKYYTYNSSRVSPAKTDYSGFDDYYHGFPIRCVAR